MQNVNFAHKAQYLARMVGIMSKYIIAGLIVGVVLGLLKISLLVIFVASFIAGVLIKYICDYYKIVAYLRNHKNED